MQRYHPNKIIRNKTTGKPLLIAHVYRTCAIVIDPTDRDLPIPHILLERDYDQWAEEKDFDDKKVDGDILDPSVRLTYNPINL